MSCNDFVHEYGLKNAETSNRKEQQIVSSLYLNDVGIYLRDGPFEFDKRFVKLHPSKETHWAFYKYGNFLIHMVLLLLRKNLSLL